MKAAAYVVCVEVQKCKWRKPTPCQSWIFGSTRMLSIQREKWETRHLEKWYETTLRRIEGKHLVVDHTYLQWLDIFHMFAAIFQGYFLCNSFQKGDIGFSFVSFSFRNANTKLA